MIILTMNSKSSNIYAGPSTTASRSPSWLPIRNFRRMTGHPRREDRRSRDRLAVTRCRVARHSSGSSRVPGCRCTASNRGRGRWGPYGCSYPKFARRVRRGSVGRAVTSSGRSDIHLLEGQIHLAVVAPGARGDEIVHVGEAAEASRKDMVGGRVAPQELRVIDVTNRTGFSRTMQRSVHDRQIRRLLGECLDELQYPTSLVASEDGRAAVTAAVAVA